MIKNYNDFIKTLLNAGFSMGGGNIDGIYSIIPWNWDEEQPYETSVSWHTGDPEHDPWEWRMRVLDERNDIVYAKLFFKKSGYITKEWYPFFLAARRNGTDFEDAYADGTISHFAKRIYDVVKANDVVASHAIKQLAGFAREDKSGFDRALTELQMKMFLTMCGQQQKVSSLGEVYGWSSNMFCTTERFWGEDVFNKADSISKEEAIDAIRNQIFKLNPKAEDKKITKFIMG